MYAAVRRYEGVTDPAEAARLVNEGFVPLMRQVPGFVAYYWLNAGNGVMVSTSVFQDQAGAEESITRAADFVRDNLASLLPTLPRSWPGRLWLPHNDVKHAPDPEHECASPHIAQCQQWDERLAKIRHRLPVVELVQFGDSCRSAGLLPTARSRSTGCVV